MDDRGQGDELSRFEAGIQLTMPMAHNDYDASAAVCKELATGLATGNCLTVERLRCEQGRQWAGRAALAPWPRAHVMLLDKQRIMMTKLLPKVPSARPFRSALL